MSEFLDRGRSGSNASTFLTRLQVGGKVVDAPGGRRAVPQPDLGGRVAAAGRRRVVAVVAALSVSDGGRRACSTWLRQWWNGCRRLVRGWFG